MYGFASPSSNDETMQEVILESLRPPRRFKDLTLPSVLTKVLSYLTVNELAVVQLVDRSAKQFIDTNRCLLPKRMVKVYTITRLHNNDYLAACSFHANEKLQFMHITRKMIEDREMWMERRSKPFNHRVTVTGDFAERAINNIGEIVEDPNAILEDVLGYLLYNYNIRSLNERVHFNATLSKNLQFMKKRNLFAEAVLLLPFALNVADPDMALRIRPRHGLRVNICGAYFQQQWSANNKDWSCEKLLRVHLEGALGSLPSPIVNHGVRLLNTNMKMNCNALANVIEDFLNDPGLNLDIRINVDGHLPDFITDKNIKGAAEIHSRVVRGPEDGRPRHFYIFRRASDKVLLVVIDSYPFTWELVTYKSYRAFEYIISRHMFNDNEKHKDSYVS